jgi:hypothetical protein
MVAMVPKVTLVLEILMLMEQSMLVALVAGMVVLLIALELAVALDFNLIFELSN